jgi:tetratricopeptide (TPR) repeat protein
MFFIKLRIAFHEQLMKAGEPELRALLEETRESFVKAGASREDEYGFYSFGDDSPGLLFQIALCAWNASRALESVSDRLFGYAITIDADESPVKCSSMIEARERMLPSAEGLFVGARARSRLDPYLDLEPDGAVFKARTLKIGGARRASAFDSYFEQSMADSIFPALERMMRGEGPPILALSCASGVDFGAAIGGMLDSMGARYDRLKVPEGSPGPRPFLVLLEGSGNLGASYAAKSALRSRFTKHVLASIAEGIASRAGEGGPRFLVVEDAERLDEYALDFAWLLVERAKESAPLLVLCGRSIEERLRGRDGYELISLDVSRNGLLLFAERSLGPELPDHLRAMIGSSVRLDLDELALADIGMARAGARNMAEILRSMGPELKELLYLFVISSAVLGCEDRTHFIEGFGILPSTLDCALGEAKAAGLLAEGSLAARKGLSRAIEAGGDVDCGGLRRSLLSYARALSETGRLSVSMEFLGHYKAAGLDSDERFSLDCLFHDLSEGAFVAPGGDATEKLLSRLYPVMSCLYDSSVEIEDRESVALDDRSLGYACERYARASYRYARERACEAMPLAKASLIRFQEARYQRGESKANRLVGLISLAQDKIIMASEYFEIAHDLAIACGSGFDAMLALDSDATAALIDGNASKAARSFDRAAEIAKALVRPDFEGHALFCKGRCLLELGYFDLAEKAFRDAASLAERFGIEGLEDLARVWRAKLEIDRGDARKALEALEGPDTSFDGSADALLFAAEAFFALGEPEACAEAAERAIERGMRRSIAPVEGLSFVSGFSCVEDASIGYGKGERAATQRAKALLGWSLVTRGRPERGLELLYEVTRGNPLSEHGPHAPFLHRLRQLAYEALGDGHRGEAEKALGKAFRALQQRASRNDDIEARDSCLGTYFAMAIIEDARALKLF